MNPVKNSCTRSLRVRFCSPFFVDSRDDTRPFEEAVGPCKLVELGNKGFGLSPASSAPFVDKLTQRDIPSACQKTLV